MPSLLDVIIQLAAASQTDPSVAMPLSDVHQTTVSAMAGQGHLLDDAFHICTGPRHDSTSAMDEESVLQPKGLASALNTTIRGGKSRLRPPPGLVLKATKPATIYPNDGSNSASNCQTCCKSLPRNPELCDNCQIWNDAHHVFECLRDLAALEKQQPLRLGKILARKFCMMCRTVGEAALESLHTEDPSIQKQISDVEIQNYGPFCLIPDQYAALNPELLQKHGLHRIESADVRLSEPPVRSESTGLESPITIRTTVYIVMVAPLGSGLRRQFPHLDEYKILQKEKEHWSDDKHLGLHRSIDSYKHDILQPTFGLQIDLTWGKDHTRLAAVSRWADTYIDTAKFIEISKLCSVQHEERRRIGDHWFPKCSLSPDHEQLPAGFKAIDTHNQCVVDLPVAPLQSYVALSYTWGGTSGVKELQLERGNCKNLHEQGSLQKFDGIPDLILDAIKFCADMGEQYLWVDRLCIVQDDLDSKMHQINAMDRIYRMASFTLVAAVPPGIGLPGVAGRPRKANISNHSRIFHPKLRFFKDNFTSTVFKSIWNTRGWTYQEYMLSRRAIYITEWQAYWICLRHAFQEEIGEFGANYNPKEFYNFRTYATTVSSYTERILTFESDILNAFAGVGNQFAKEMGKPLLYGLPEQHFARALLWEHASDVQKRYDAIDIPTWSWAAWRGRCGYDLNSKGDSLRVGTLVRFYVYDRESELRRILEDEIWFFKNLDFDTLGVLPVVNPLYPEMRFMPSSTDTGNEWRVSMQSPWTVSSKDTISIADVAGLQEPGRLIFRTTSASVRLRMPTLLNYTLSSDYTKLDICNHREEVVGQMSQLPQLWIDANLDLNQQHEIIVIAAGVASEIARYAQTHTTLHVSGGTQQPRTGDSLWYLHVMLVSRDNDGVARRVGIGIVEMESWNRCRPEWRTVVLA